jgi:NTP pyrophosphatase (non-canonical NTP hydrolase)
MRLSVYRDLAVRTESVLDPATLTDVQQEALKGIRILLQEDLLVLGAKLDQLKRIAFYGRTLDLPKGINLDRTLLDPTPLNATGLRLLHAITGLCTETAEIAAAVVDRPPGAGLDPVNLAEEFGDTAWYLAIGLDALDLDGDRVLEGNLAKLRARYPDRFTAEHAENRNLTEERAALEGLDDTTFDARLERVLRAGYSSPPDVRIPKDILAQCGAIPPEFLQERFRTAIEGALDAWVREAIPALRLSLSAEDLRLLEPEPGSTDKTAARVKLDTLLARFELNLRFQTLFMNAVEACASEIAGTLHAVSGTTTPEA